MNDFEIVDILLVEDNPCDAELTLRALRKNIPANKVYIVEDGQEAVDFLLCKGLFDSRNIEFPPKVVFLDLKLPKLNGFDVLKIVKSNERLSQVPVVIVTSSPEVRDIKEAYRFGANGYVVKPVDYNQFVEAMNIVGLYWVLINQTTRN